MIQLSNTAFADPSRHIVWMQDRDEKWHAFIHETIIDHQDIEQIIIESRAALALALA